jgi:hypothetical protein
MRCLGSEVANAAVVEIVALEVWVIFRRSRTDLAPS